MGRPHYTHASWDTVNKNTLSVYAKPHHIATLDILLRGSGTHTRYAPLPCFVARVARGWQYPTWITKTQKKVLDKLFATTHRQYILVADAKAIRAWLKKHPDSKLHNSPYLKKR